MPEFALQTVALTREYRVGHGTVTALAGVNIALQHIAPSLKLSDCTHMSW